MNGDYRKEHYQTVSSKLEDVECWEIFKVHHYVRTTDDLYVPLPVMYSVEAEIADRFGYSLPFNSYTLEDIQKHIHQAEELYKEQNISIPDGHDLRENLDPHYGVL